MIPFKVGDTYIRFSKYGSIQIGTIDRVEDMQCIDLTRRIAYLKTTIVNSNGISFEIDGTNGQIYRIARELTDEQVEKGRKFLEKLQQKRVRNPFTNEEIQVRVIYPGYGSTIIDENMTGSIISREHGSFVFRDHSDKLHYFPVNYTIFDEVE